MKDHIDFLIDDVIKTIQGIENPYPPDIFTWDNSEPINITKGRFNQHVYEVAENMRKGIIEAIKELIE